MTIWDTTAEFNSRHYFQLYDQHASVYYAIVVLVCKHAINKHNLITQLVAKEIGGALLPYELV